MRLSAERARVLGSLVEKELTTPQQYPLTIMSLIAACNQASNREPVVDYDESTVRSALDELKGQKLVRFVLPSHGRTAVRYRHVLDEALALDHRQCALLAVLLLRGPQTIGELRGRTDRMTQFDGLDEVEHELGFMSSLEEPLTTRLSRRPGQKEERWACPLVDSGSALSVLDEQDGAEPSRPAEAAGVGDRLDDLQSELTDLRSEVSELRRDLNELRSSLGD